MTSGLGYCLSKEIKKPSININIITKDPPKPNLTLVHRVLIDTSDLYYYPLKETKKGKSLLNINFITQNTNDLNLIDCIPSCEEEYKILQFKESSVSVIPCTKQEIPLS
jgi:hypothetical protein